MNLQNVSTEFRKAHDLIDIYIKTGGLTYEREVKLYNIYILVKDINTTIDNVKRDIVTNMDIIYEQAGELRMVTSELNMIFSSNLKILSKFSTKEDCDTSLKPLRDQIEKERKEVNVLWMDYKSMSNRLDYLPMDSDDFIELDKKCDAKKVEHDAAQQTLLEHDSIYRKKKLDMFGLYNFDLLYLQAICYQYHRLADAIISDIDKIRKEESK